jgi:hypothetical protein
MLQVIIMLGIAGLVGVDPAPVANHFAPVLLPQVQNSKYWLAEKCSIKETAMTASAFAPLKEYLVLELATSAPSILNQNSIEFPADGQDAIPDHVIK